MFAQEVTGQRRDDILRNMESGERNYGYWFDETEV
jgi:hypothetical protein